MIVIHFGKPEEFVDEICVFEKNLKPRIVRVMFQLAPIQGKKTIYSLWLLASAVVVIGQEHHIIRMEYNCGDCDPKDISDPAQAVADNKYDFIKQICAKNNIALRPGYYAWAAERS